MDEPINHDNDEILQNALEYLDQDNTDDFITHIYSVLDNVEQPLETTSSMVDEALTDINFSDANADQDVHSFAEWLLEPTAADLDNADNNAVDVVEDAVQVQDNEEADSSRELNEQHSQLISEDVDNNVELLPDMKIKIKGRGIADYKSNSTTGKNGSKKINKKRNHGKTPYKRRKNKKSNLKVQPALKVKKENEMCVDIATIPKEIPLTLSSDVGNLLEQFEASQNSLVNPLCHDKVSTQSNQEVKAEASTIQPLKKTLPVLPENKSSPVFSTKKNSPVFPRNTNSLAYSEKKKSPPSKLMKDINDPESKEVINRIKASFSKKPQKIVPLIPAMPNIPKGRRTNGKRIPATGATSSKNKPLKVADNVNDRTINSGSIKLDHDYCNSSGSTVNNSNNSANKKKASDNHNKTLSENNKSKNLNHPKTKTVKQPESHAKNEKVSVEKNCTKDTGLKSDKKSDNNKTSSISDSVNRVEKQMNKQTEKCPNDPKSQKQNIQSPKNLSSPNVTGGSNNERKLSSAIVTKVWQSKSSRLNTPEPKQNNKQMVSVLKKPQTVQPRVQPIAANNSDCIVKTIDNSNNVLQSTQVKQMVSVLKKPQTVQPRVQPIAANKSDSIVKTIDSSNKVLQSIQDKQMVSALKNPQTVQSIVQPTAANNNDSIVTTVDSSNNVVQNTIIQNTQETSKEVEKEKPLRRKLNLTEYRNRREPEKYLLPRSFENACTSTEPIEDEFGIVRWVEKEFCRFTKPIADLNDMEPKPLMRDNEAQTIETIFRIPDPSLVVVERHGEEQGESKPETEEKPISEEHTLDSTLNQSSGQPCNESKNPNENQNLENRSRSKSPNEAQTDETILEIPKQSSMDVDERNEEEQRKRNLETEEELLSKKRRLDFSSSRSRTRSYSKSRSPNENQNVENKSRSRSPNGNRNRRKRSRSRSRSLNKHQNRRNRSRSRSTNGNRNRRNRSESRSTNGDRNRRNRSESRSTNGDRNRRKRSRSKSLNKHQNRRNRSRSRSTNGDRNRRKRSRSRSSWENVDIYHKIDHRLNSGARSNSRSRYSISSSKSSRSSSPNSLNNSAQYSPSVFSPPSPSFNDENRAWSNRKNNFHEVDRRRHDSYREMSLNNPHPYQERRQPTFYRNQNFNKEDIPQEREYIVYAGRLENNVTLDALLRRFSIFGTVMQITLHFPRDKYKDKYSFITYRFKHQAAEAIKYGNSDRNLPIYDLNYGNRREFCGAQYEDLDTSKTIKERNQDKVEKERREILRMNREESFDSLLKKAKAEKRLV